MIVVREPEAPSMVLPLVAGAAAVGGFLYLRQQRGAGPRRQRSRRDLNLAAPLPAPPGRWVWPLPRWQGRAPVISDGWGSPRATETRGAGGAHQGVDLMYRRRSLRELVDVFPPRAPHSLWHFLPPGTVVLAAADGEVWSAGDTPRGASVVLSHGTPWASYYTHLALLYVAPSRRGSSKQRVRAGQPLGLVGADPTDARGIAHLHFEIWLGGDGSAAVDPAPLLSGFAVLDSPGGVA